MANRYSASTGMNTRRNMTRVGRPTRAAGAVRTRAGRTGRGRSTRMAAGRMGSSSLIANSNTNRIVAQRSRMGSNPRNRMGQNAAGRSNQVPSNYTKVRMERPNFAANGLSRYRNVYCPPGQTTFTNACVEVKQGATTSPLAQTSAIRGMARGNAIRTRTNPNRPNNPRRMGRSSGY